MSKETGTFQHIAVLMGGWSSERDVSLTSGAACSSALEREGYRVTRIDVNRDVADRLAILKPDAAFNALHGKWGEDGCIQGVLETLEIPYTHSGVLASALAMDKARAKVVFKAASVPVAEGIVASCAEAARGHLMAPPYVIKPVAEGSSVGVFIVREDHEFPPQELTRPDWTYGDVLIERYIGGRELTCAVLGDRPLASSRFCPPKASVSMTTKQNTQKEAHATFYRRKFHRTFTSLSKNWQLMLIMHWAAGA